MGRIEKVNQASNVDDGDGQKNQLLLSDLGISKNR
jgi:hypothetical protein